MLRLAKLSRFRRLVLHDLVVLLFWALWVSIHLRARFNGMVACRDVSAFLPCTLTLLIFLHLALLLLFPL